MQTETESDKENTKVEQETEPAVDKMETDKDEEEEKSVIKLVLLETIGKCWPYSTDMQGIFPYKLRPIS